jgi:hypothetical protein
VKFPLKKKKIFGGGVSVNPFTTGVVMNMQSGNLFENSSC